MNLIFSHWFYQFSQHWSQNAQTEKIEFCLSKEGQPSFAAFLNMYIPQAWWHGKSWVGAEKMPWRPIILKGCLVLISQDYKVTLISKHIKIVADRNTFFGVIKKYRNQWHLIQSSPDQGAPGIEVSVGRTDETVPFLSQVKHRGTYYKSEDIKPQGMFTFKERKL